MVNEEQDARGATHFHPDASNTAAWPVPSRLQSAISADGVGHIRDGASEYLGCFVHRIFQNELLSSQEVSECLRRTQVCRRQMRRARTKLQLAKKYVPKISWTCFCQRR